MITQPIEFVQLFILVLAVVFLIVAVEYKRLYFAIISFALGNGFVSLAFFALGAFYVAVFNLTVFSGAVVIMFLTMMNLESPEDEKEEGSD